MLGVSVGVSVIVGVIEGVIEIDNQEVPILDGSAKMFVEKILKAGEVLEIKNNWFNGNLLSLIHI